MTTQTTRIASTRMQSALRVVLATALLTAVCYFVDVRTVWRHVEAFDRAVGALMLGTNAALFALLAARWHSVARELGVHAPYGRFLSATWLGAFFSQLGPSVVLNEVTRFRLLVPYARKWPLAMSQFLDRVSGQVVLAAIVLALTPHYLTLFTTALGHRIVLTATLVVLIAGAALVLTHRFRRSVELRPGTLRRFSNPFASPTHYACSLAIQLLLMVNLGLAAHGLGGLEHGIEVFLAAPLVLGTLTILPLSVADWGSREAVALLFFSATGLTPEEIVAVSLIYGGINVLAVLPAGLLLFHARVRGQASRGV